MGIREDWNDKILVFDGGMGSLLQGAGLKPGELPETWNIKHPEVLVKIHEDYLNAGANIILSNTFGANRLKYNEAAEFNLDEIVDAAMKNARTAVEHCGRGYVALDLGPTGRLLKPMGDLDFEEAVSIYTEVVKAGVRGGADLILIETMSDTYELKAAVLAAKENSDLPIFATTIFDGKRQTFNRRNTEVRCGTFGRSGRGCARNQLWIRSGSDEADCGRTASVCVDPGGCQSKCGTSAKRGRKDRI